LYEQAHPIGSKKRDELVTQFHKFKKYILKKDRTIENVVVAFNQLLSSITGLTEITVLDQGINKPFSYI
jgi:hypothetical protein